MQKKTAIDLESTPTMILPNQKQHPLPLRHNSLYPTEHVSFNHTRKYVRLIKKLFKFREL